MTKNDSFSSEKEKIARHLHDVVANELLHFQFMFLKVEPYIDKETFAKMTDRLNYIRNQIRNISHELTSPNDFNESNNLAERIRSFLVDYSYLFSDIRFEFNCFPGFVSESNYPSSELMIILKELINNAVKYSCASIVDINLTEFKDSISLIIEDNGIGIKKPLSSKGIGIKNLAIRVNKLGGKLKMETALGKGSSFIIELKKNESTTS